MREIRNTTQRLAVLGRPYQVHNGVIYADLAWAAANLVYVPMPQGLVLSWDHGTITHRVRCHRLLADQLQGAFVELMAKRLWDELGSFAGSYIVRRQRGSKAISAHAFGIALDFNSENMPQGSPAQWPVKVVDVWNAHGFINGAGFKRPDPMHWEALKVFP